MSSYLYSFTPLPTVRSGGTDIEVAMTSPVSGETAVIEVKHGQAPAQAGNHLEIDRVLLDARSRIAAITGLAAHDISVSAFARGYSL